MTTEPAAPAELPVMDALNQRFPLPPRTCGHCGRRGAEAFAGDVRLCHPSDLSLPDCYRRVTVYGEAIGALMGMEPKPAGVEGIIMG